MTDILAIDTETMARAVADALHGRVGPKCPVTDKEAARALGVDVRSIKAYRLADQPPRAATLLRMFAWLGPAFANDVLAVAGLHCLPLEGGDANELLLNQDTAKLLGELADALADGRIDHRERHRIREKARNLLPRVTAYIDNSAPPVRSVSAAE